MSFLSASVAWTVAILGFSFTTEASFAKTRVEKVYLWYVTSGRMAQKRYVLRVEEGNGKRETIRAL